MARGIKSDYVRAAEEEGKFQHSMAEAMSQDDILKTRQAKLGVKEDIKQSWRDFGAEALVTGELLINKLRDRTLVEKGVAELEKRTGYTMNFQKDSLLDVLSGKSDFKKLRPPEIIGQLLHRLDQLLCQEDIDLDICNNGSTAPHCYLYFLYP